jgi:hypothetical protein
MQQLLLSILALEVQAQQLARLALMALVHR